MVYCNTGSRVLCAMHSMSESSMAACFRIAKYCVRFSTARLIAGQQINKDVVAVLAVLRDPLLVGSRW
jgi:hypothetical protein